MEFHGAKAATFVGSQLLVYLRDEKVDIPHPGCWDFPGGGHEGLESPFACIAREIREEFALSVAEHQVRWTRAYPATTHPGRTSCFLVIQLPYGDQQKIIFGDEGQLWQLMSVEDYFEHPNAIASLQQRLRDYLASQ